MPLSIICYVLKRLSRPQIYHMTIETKVHVVTNYRQLVQSYHFDPKIMASFPIHFLCQGSQVDSLLRNFMGNRDVIPHGLQGKVTINIHTYK